MNIAILLFEAVDLLDAGGPYEVFLTASRLVERDGADKLFTVSTVSIDDQPVTAYGGLGLIPSGRISDAAQADVLIVPGTIDIETTAANAQLISQISAFYKNGNSERIVASVCTGSFLLAKARLLDNRHWTTHWEDIDLLTDKLSHNELADNGAKRSVRWVDSGSVVTGAGLSSGIDMALHLVDRLGGLELAQRTAKQIDYSWTNEDSSHA